VLSEAKVLTHGKTPMSNLDEKDKWSQDVTRYMLSIFTFFRFIGLLQGLPNSSNA
jgi:hypothetical protein